MKRLIIIVSMVLGFWASNVWADPCVLFFDDFDDGNYDGWTVEEPVFADCTWIPAVPPTAVPSPEGCAIAGQDNSVGQSSSITHPILASNVGELSMEMVATSGRFGGYAVDADMLLWSGCDLYMGFSYKGQAEFVILVDGVERVFFNATPEDGWHRFKWTRDVEGWWSFSLDGVIVDPNFVQDKSLTSFDLVHLGLNQGESKIEWIRISANAEPPCGFSDDFNDGNYDGWSPTHPITGDPATPPDVVPSPQGYSLRGIGSGYSPDPGLNVWLTYPLQISNASELKVEMRAKSGPQWPNSAWVVLVSGDDSYSFGDYGEGNQWAQFTPNVGGVSEWYNYSINANVWHDFAWTRDADGWWSLSIDANLVWEDFCRDNRLTSFDRIGVHILRNQSEIEWVRISGVCAIPVPVDIKPESCPNPLNVKSKGNICVAILGSEDFDANAIDPAAVRLQGVAPLRSSLEDVATPVVDGNECQCNTAGPDGYTDLTVKFDTQQLVAAIGDVNSGDVLQLELTGVLNDGTPIEGTDCIVLVGNFKAFKKGDINKDGITDTIDFTLMAETWLESTLEDN